MKKPCRECSTYSTKLKRCSIGKICPPTIKGGIDAVQWMGMSYICSKSPYYQKIFNAILQEAKTKKEELCQQKI